MRNFIEWLKGIWSGRAAQVGGDESGERQAIKSTDRHDDVPDARLDDLEATRPDLRAANPPRSDFDKSEGFDPYDTAKLLKN